MLRVMSANRLRDGIIVYLGPYGDWVTRIGDASLLTSEDACAAASAKARAAVGRQSYCRPAHRRRD